MSELVSYGLSLTEAERLVGTHGEERCRRVLRHAPAQYDSAVRKMRWMVLALANGWQVGKPPRDWKINGGEDLDALIADYGRQSVVLEVERRAAGRDVKPLVAERRRLVAAHLRAGMTGLQAAQAAQQAVQGSAAP